MNLVAQLARFNVDPDVIANIQAQIARQEQLQQEIAHKELKIQALTLELARYRRLHYRNKSEAFDAQQLALFEQSWAVDMSAIEAELE